MVKHKTAPRLDARGSTHPNKLRVPQHRRKTRRKKRIRIPALWPILIKTVAVLVILTVAIVLPWRWINPPTSAFMLATYFSSSKKVRHNWTSLKRISPHLAMAVVASEDQKFPSHHGFDFASIQDAMSDHPSQMRGASTITQQVAKNLFLWNGRSYLRKGIEAYLTVYIELLWSKKRILEVYLNIAEFGPGIYGAQSASKLYFRKSTKYLTPHESVLLAAVLPNPNKMSAAKPSRYVIERASRIRASIRNLGGTQYIAAIIR